MKSFYTLLLASMVSLSVSAQNVDADKARAAQNKALRDSLSKATEVLAYHPDSIDLRLKKAAWNIQLEQWQYAKDDLDKVLFLNNTNIAGLFYRAFVNEKLLRYNFARLDYQNLLVLVPGNFQAQLGLALLNEKDKHYTEAYDGINSLIEQYPDSAMAYAARGGMEKAMELDAGNEDFAFNHVDILIQLGRKDEVYRDLKKLLDAGCQPGRLQNFYARLKKKKK